MIPLNGDVDLTTMKSIHADVESKLWPGPFGFLFTESESIKSSARMGPSAPSSFPEDGNDNFEVGEKPFDRYHCLNAFCHSELWCDSFLGFELVLNLYPHMVDSSVLCP
ncbi:hypothetical protein Tco_1019336 [Tanacetum coccineum]|uniref:Uncharacterized protein n=1 Tax=Tanacetum coccineum TaxID=301880 RepID=A0ABQ5FWZ6_9ASTR